MYLQLVNHCPMLEGPEHACFDEAQEILSTRTLNQCFVAHLYTPPMHGDWAVEHYTMLSQSRINKPDISAEGHVLCLLHLLDLQRVGKGLQEVAAPASWHCTHVSFHWASSRQLALYNEVAGAVAIEHAGHAAS